MDIPGLHIIRNAFLWAKLLQVLFHFVLFCFFFFALWWICSKGIFFMNRGLDACSFLSVKWAGLFPEERCTVKASLVVTHYVFIFVSHYDVSRVLLPMFAIGWFNEVWLMPFLALPMWNLACYLVFLLTPVWAMWQNQNGWTDFLCFVNIKKQMFCVFYVVVEYFLTVKLHICRQSDSLFSKFEVVIKW